jgi:hypothetical protein
MQTMKYKEIVYTLQELHMHFLLYSRQCYIQHISQRWLQCEKQKGKSLPHWELNCCDDWPSSSYLESMNVLYVNNNISKHKIIHTAMIIMYQFIMPIIKYLNLF